MGTMTGGWDPCQHNKWWEGLSGGLAAEWITSTPGVIRSDPSRRRQREQHLTQGAGAVGPLVPGHPLLLLHVPPDWHRFQLAAAGFQETSRQVIITVRTQQ